MKKEEKIDTPVADTPVADTLVTDTPKTEPSANEVQDAIVVPPSNELNLLRFIEPLIGDRIHRMLTVGPDDETNVLVDDVIPTIMAWLDTCQAAGITVTHLTMSGSSYDKSAVIALGPVFERVAKSLESLCLSDVFATQGKEDGHEAQAQLAQEFTVEKAPLIARIDLGCNAIGSPKYLKALFEGRPLEVLLMNDAGMDHDGVDDLFRFLGQTVSSIEHFDVSENCA